MSRSGAETPGPAPNGRTVQGRTVPGRTLHWGRAEGPLLRLDTPVSFWGGVDLAGRIVDGHHPQCGQSVTGTVLAMSSGRGSSSSTAVLAEQIRVGTAPAAVVLAECDTILVIAALVAAELYDVAMPVVLVSAEDLAMLRAGRVSVRADRDTLDAAIELEGPA